MSTPDFTMPPNDVPVWLKYLMHLPQDATRKEVEAAWHEHVAPLVLKGPAHLFDVGSDILRGGGLTGPQARRVFKQTRRGAQLAAAAEREGKARARLIDSKPPFATTAGKTNTSAVTKK